MKRFNNAILFAIAGFLYFILTERNGKLQFVAGILAIIAGIALNITTTEWCLIACCIASVLSLELMNSTIEQLCNLIQPGYHHTIKNIKDMAAAAVLLTALSSVIIGSCIFLPKFIK
jgi:diacylglycerol kinase